MPSPPQFTPPSAEFLNLPSAQPAGNPAFAPASVGMPSMKLDDTLSGKSGGSGALGDFFDWAKKLQFFTALRGGYDSNVNQGHNNATNSVFANVNGGVSYHFGEPRLNVSASLTGGLTEYANYAAEPYQGTLGLGVAVEYRYAPRLVLTFNTSSSYQVQPNPSLAGSATTLSQNGNGALNGYIYSANSLAAAYQWSDIFTVVTRLNYTEAYYFLNSQQESSGFIQPGFGESLRWLYQPTTTLVLDYNANTYDYATSGNNSFGQSLSAGFDHIFNPKFFWNIRAGAEVRDYQNSISGNGSYIGPYFDNTLSWQFARSSLSWNAHVGTQPSGQKSVSYAPSYKTSLNYTQGIFTKFTLNAGVFYQLVTYPNATGVTSPTPDNPLGLLTYNQSNIQGTLNLAYQINRILQASIGYQYITQSSPSVPFQEYNRGISYLQLGGNF